MVVIVPWWNLFDTVTIINDRIDLKQQYPHVRTIPAPAHSLF